MAPAEGSRKNSTREVVMEHNRAREGHVEIESELCKGCEFCVDVCPEECLAMADLINSRGYRFALYEGDRCTGCGVCYYNCPEPGAIAVYKSKPDSKEN
jgi:NAD-dependent dihydropyrimidine dehydrogenase PreA subunit